MNSISRSTGSYFLKYYRASPTVHSSTRYLNKKIIVNSPNNSSVRLSHHLSATIPSAYDASSTISSSSTNNSSNKEIDHLGYRLNSLALGLNNTSVFSQASSRSHALGSSASRLFSTNASEDAVGSSLHFKSHDSESEYMLLPFLPRGKKLKPHVVKKRLSKMKTYIGTEKNIRHSPWRLNLICQFAAGQTVNDALMQLQFCQKGFAPLVSYFLFIQDIIICT